MEEWYDGYLTKYFAFTIYIICMYLQGDMIEDFLCGGLGVIGGVWHNWGAFWPYWLQSIVAWALVSYYDDGTKAQYRLLRDINVTKPLGEFKHPFNHAMVDFNIPIEDECFFLIVATMNVIFACHGIYYTFKWVDNIRFNGRPSGSRSQKKKVKTH
jgi:hypothetical protein